MASSHHGAGPLPEDPDRDARLGKIIDRLQAQMDGTAKRDWPRGRIAADDDGELALAVAADPAKNVVVIHFGKPVEWIGLGPAEVNALINLLMHKLRDLGVPATISV